MSSSCVGGNDFKKGQRKLERLSSNNQGEEYLEKFNTSQQMGYNRRISHQDPLLSDENLFLRLEDLQHDCAADKYVAIIGSNHVNQHLKPMFPTPWGISA